MIRYSRRTPHKQRCQGKCTTLANRNSEHLLRLAVLSSPRSYELWKVGFSCSMSTCRQLEAFFHELVTESCSNVASGIAISHLQNSEESEHAATICVMWCFGESGAGTCGFTPLVKSGRYSQQIYEQWRTLALRRSQPTSPLSQGFTSNAAQHTEVSREGVGEDTDSRFFYGGNHCGFLRKSRAVIKAIGIPTKKICATNWLTKSIVSQGRDGAAESFTTT